MTRSLHSKLILSLVALGLVAIFATSLQYRFSNGQLVKVRVADRASQTAMPGATMPPANASVPPGMAPAMEPAGPPTDAAMATMSTMDPATREQMLGFMQTLQAKPTDVSALTGLANLFITKADWARAGEFARKAVAAAPSEALPAYLLGLIQANQQNYLEAAESLERSLSLEDKAATRYTLAVVYIYHLVQPEKGLEHLQKAAALPEATEDSTMGALIHAELTKLNTQANSAPAAGTTSADTTSTDTTSASPENVPDSANSSVAP